MSADFTRAAQIDAQLARLERHVARTRERLILLKAEAGLAPSREMYEVISLVAKSLLLMYASRRVLSQLRDMARADAAFAASLPKPRASSAVPAAEAAPPRLPRAASNR